jgi:hypothetical protein
MSAMRTERDARRLAEVVEDIASHQGHVLDDAYAWRPADAFASGASGSQSGRTIRSIASESAVLTSILQAAAISGVARRWW